MTVGPSSGDYAPAHVPMIFVEPDPQRPPPEAPKPPAESGGLVISKGFLGALVVLLLGAAIAGTGGFYWLWQKALTENKTVQTEIQAKLDAVTKANTALIADKTQLTADLKKSNDTLTPYAEVVRLQGETQSERQKIATLLQVPSKTDYWKYHKSVDLEDPPLVEPAVRDLKSKLDQLQKISADIGLWTKPSPGPTTAPGVIRPNPN